MIVTNVILSLSAALSFYMIPVIIGSILYSIYEIILHIKGVKTDRDLNIFFVVPVRFVKYFMTGSLTIFMLTLGVNRIYGSDTYSILPNYLAAFVAVSIMLICLKYTISKPLRKSDSVMIKKSAKLLFVLICIAVISQAIWHFKSPLDTSLDWDIYLHQTLTNALIQGKISPNTADLSDSIRVSAYSTMFHTVLAIPYSVFQPNVIYFWTFLDMFHNFGVIVAAFLFGYAVSKSLNQGAHTGELLHGVKVHDEETSLTIGLISALIAGLVFDSIMSFTTYFLIPQTLTAIVSVVGISDLIYKIGKRGVSNSFLKENIVHVGTGIPIIITLPFLILSHKIIGFLGIVIILLLLVYSYVHQTKYKKIFSIFTLITAVLTAVILPFVAAKIDPEVINPGEAQFYVGTILDKISYFQRFYGYLAFILVPLGLISIANKKHSTGVILIALFCGFVALVISPIPYVMKFVSIGRFVVGTLMALGFWALVKDLSGQLKQATLASLAVTLIIILSININIYKQTPRYGDIYTHVSPSEIKAAEFLKKDYAGTKNTILISDPATMFILEGLSGVNSPAGAYATTENRKLIAKIYYERNKKVVIDTLEKVADPIADVDVKITDGRTSKRNILLIIGGRYGEWVRASDEFILGFQENVWAPKDLKMEDYDFIRFLESNFKVIFSNRALVIFEI